MFKLEKPACAAAHARYRSQEAFFPLIGAVLLGEQDGSVYGDHPQSPDSIYVEHAFGFAQVFGAPNPHFDAALQQYLMHDKALGASKIRLYTPRLPDFLAPSLPGVSRAERQRFVHDRTARKRADTLPSGTTVDITTATPANLASIEAAFNLARRFWRSDADFLARANASVAWSDGRPAAICYAAAVADDRAEIDVVTRPEYRRAGLGEAVVRSFIDRCHGLGLAPVWDCFTNNAGSMGLCQSCGFVPRGPAYPFFTINRQSP